MKLPVGMALGSWVLASLILAADEGDKKPSRPTAEPVAAPLAPSAYEYVGTKKCRMCHGRQYESWRDSAKGHSWDALRPGVSHEVKAKAGLDVNRDYTTDAQCLSCHSVGYGKPGGYAIPDPVDQKSARLAAAREGVGCEACHGPGSGFVQIMEDIYKTGRAYNPEELRAVGRHTVSAEVCTTCHNETARCMAAPPEAQSGARTAMIPKVEAADRTGYHARFPLVHRVAAPHEEQPTKSDVPLKGD